MTSTDHPVTPVTPVAPPGDVGARDDHNVRLAWACLLSLPVFFVLAFVLGTGLGTVMGVDEGATASTGVALLVILTMLVLFAIPTGLAWLFANRARDRGDIRGRVPAIVVTVFAAAFVFVNLMQWLLGFFVGSA